MTADDLVKVMMAGTGAVATIYQIHAAETNPSVLRQTIGTDLGTPVTYSAPQTGTILTLGLLVLGVLFVFKK